MTDLIELTFTDGDKLLINPDNVGAMFQSKGESYTRVHICGGPEAAPWRVAESYDSIKETLRKHGVNVFSVIPVDGPQQVLVPRAWLEAVQPVLKAWCQSRTCTGDCPLGIDDVCVQKELPRLIRGEIHA